MAALSGHRPKAVGRGTERIVAAGPEARRLARELGVDLSRGSRQRQGRADHRRRRSRRGRRATKALTLALTEGEAGTEPAAPGELGQDAYGPVRRQRMSKIRRTIAAQMVKSASTIPHVTNFDDADVTDLEQMRKTIPPAYLGRRRQAHGDAVCHEGRGPGPAAASGAQRQHRRGEGGDRLQAVREPGRGGRYAPRAGGAGDAQRRPDGRSCRSPGSWRRWRRGPARPSSRVDELRGGTFTISNLGAVGGTYSTPIINHPEVAILLVGRSRWLLGVHEGKIEGRLMMPLSLSYDHRVVDGAAASRFLNDVIDYLQSPGKLLLTK